MKTDKSSFKILNTVKIYRLCVCVCVCEENNNILDDMGVSKLSEKVFFLKCTPLT